MVGQRIMAVLAGIVKSAALHLDRNDVQRRVVVDAARLTVQIDSAYMGARLRHRYRVEDSGWQNTSCWRDEWKSRKKSDQRNSSKLKRRRNSCFAKWKRAV